MVVDARGNHHRPAGPRGGQFMPKGGGKDLPPGAPQKRSKNRQPKPATSSKAKGPTPYTRASTGDLIREFHRLSRGAELSRDDSAALDALDAELARRKGVPELHFREDPRLAELDALVADGVPFMEAWAEAHGLDVADLEHQERMALVDAERRKGESREKTLRRMYQQRVALEVLQAENDTGGHLLNREAEGYNARRRSRGERGVSAAELWSATPARARKYASDELKQWWSEHGGRASFATFRAQYVTTRGAKGAAEKSRLSGSGRDYGV